MGGGRCVVDGRDGRWGMDGGRCVVDGGGWTMCGVRWGWTMCDVRCVMYGGGIAFSKFKI